MQDSHKFNRWIIVLLFLGVVLWVTPSTGWAEYGDVSDPDTWYEDLNLGKRMIYVWLSLSALCIAIAYLFVGPVAREMLALGIGCGFQLVSNPELLKNPGQVFKTNWKMVMHGRTDDQAIIFFFVWLLVVFFAVMLVVSIQMMLASRNEKDAGYRSD